MEERGQRRPPVSAGGEHSRLRSETYLHEEDADDESRALTVAHLPVVERVRFHHVEQALLAEAILLFEEVVLRVRAGDVAPDNLVCQQKHSYLLAPTTLITVHLIVGSTVSGCLNISM